MRGNWETAEPMAAPPGQQQSKQLSVEEHRSIIPHLPATPAWNTTDRIVKEEPEDKNNDSGVSPGHYTSNSASPRSRRSSSTANCSLSPGSATSQDSNAMQCNFEYSPQRLFKSCASPIGFGHIKMSTPYNTIEENGSHQPDQPLDTVSSTMKSENEDMDGIQDTLQCPICAFTTAHRLQFTEHLAAHCARKCDTADFPSPALSQVGSHAEESRSSPTQGDRSEQESEEADEPGLRVPRVNSQGKVKTFRCKQCNFVAITKLEFWEHSRGHIKAEKLLTCPKCPFVTEYKHHLEYHLRNHFGSKPFKCDKCSYSCVNKSMLNSHLKSHSNVYQYRCANCSYATKYCHSLKLHLRKYSHKPAMVLNADGSPNPLPIIDIYGTRRGPKQKSQKSDDTMAVQPSVVSCRSPTSSQNSQFISEVPTTPIPMPFAYSQILSNFTLPNHFLNFTDNNNDKKLENFQPSSMLFDYGLNFNNREKIEEYAERDFKQSPSAVFGSNGGQLDVTITEVDSKVSPLDLSKPEVTSAKTSSPRAGGTSRRKGRAFKLDRLVVEHDSEEESYEAQVNSTPAPNTFCLNGKDDRMTGGANGEYTCQYCDIAFGNVVMYTMHMGYHGYKNPYTCNMCGQQCADKVSFFLHIARSSHS